MADADLQQVTASSSLPSELRSFSYLTEAQTAELLSCSVQTLRNNRFARKGLPYCKIGRSVRYPLKAVVEYLEQHKVEHHLMSVEVENV